MDRERLKEVHQTDITESRVNEDFVDWLKNKGPTWLLAIVMAVAVYMVIVRYKEQKVAKQSDAWQAFFTADLPGSFEDVAREFGNVGKLGPLSRLSAADRLMQSIRSGRSLSAPVATPGTNPTPTDPEDSALTDEEREQYLTRAAGLYQQVIDEDDDSLAMTLHVLNALSGQAAVAESRGDAEAARGWYAKAAARAEGRYPGLAAQAQARMETVDRMSQEIEFRPASEVAKLRGTRPDVQPIGVDDALLELVLPEEADASGR